VSPIADWVINLIAAHPVTAVLTPAVAIAVWLALNAASRRIERRRERQAEAERLQRRQADLDTCNAIWNTPSPRRETP
jgi:7-keto-8-aminopelargonate synthetase-like enzyme